jgi:hypothetical protein
MKFIVKLFLVSVLLFNCSSNRYLLEDENSKDKKFLINTIKESKSKGGIASNKPIIVLDGKPLRYNHELKEEKLHLLKSDIKKIDVLKKEVGIRLYGDFAEGGVLVLTTKKDLKTKEKQDDNNSSTYHESNILFLVDGKEITKKFVESLNPDDIESVDVIKGKKASKEIYPDKNYDGIIHVKMKQK